MMKKKCFVVRCIQKQKRRITVIMKYYCISNRRYGRKLFYSGSLLFCLLALYLLSTLHISPLTQLSEMTKSATIYRNAHSNSSIPHQWFHNSNSSHQNNSYGIFSSKYVISELPITKWLAEPATFCGGNFIGYAHLFAQLKDVKLDPSKNFNHKGGEEIKDVKDQSENAEYLTLDLGYFTLSCPSCADRINYVYNAREPNSQWLKALKCSTSQDNSIVKEKVIDNFVIAVQRYEYVNIYHTMTDWFNTFLMALVFKQNPKNIKVLFMDGHPKGSLDRVWKTLFGSTLQAGRLDRPLLLHRLVWSINGYGSFINQHSLSTVPYIEEFRSFFLQAFNIPTNHKKDCKSLNIFFVFRHDYVAHPRNMKGVIKRKIENEQELINNMVKSFPGDKVTGVQLDSLPFEKQLHTIANTDILIGMHGAGMTMSIFLPSTSGVIELYPSYFSPNNVHFKSIAKWKKIKYTRWQNKISGNEHKNYNTYIHPSVIIDLITETKNAICNTL